MKKLFLSFALLAGLTVATQAQSRKDAALNGTKLSVGADFAFPTSNWGTWLDYGVGGSLALIAPINNKASFVGEAGYLSFAYKTNLIPNIAYIPLKAGVRYSLTDNFYAQGQIGASIGTGSGTKTGFLYAPSVGAEFPVADKMTIDFGARYEGWTGKVISPSFIGLRAALNFGM
jgi:opacity protein-like surface antigen